MSDQVEEPSYMHQHMLRADQRISRYLILPANVRPSHLDLLYGARADLDEALAMYYQNSKPAHWVQRVLFGLLFTVTVWLAGIGLGEVLGRLTR